MKDCRAFTLIELLVILGLLAVIGGGVFLSFSTLFVTTELDITSREVAYAIRKAETNALVRFRNQSWGVHFDESGSRATLFASSSYPARDPQFDMSIEFPRAISLGAITLNGGGREVVFRKGDGLTTNYGLIELQDANRQKRTIIVNQVGQLTIN